MENVLQKDFEKRMLRTVIVETPKKTVPTVKNQLLKPSDVGALLQQTSPVLSRGKLAIAEDILMRRQKTQRYGSPQRTKSIYKSGFHFIFF